MLARRRGSMELALGQSTVRTRHLFCVLVVVWICVFAAGCKRTTDKSRPVNASYVEVYSLSSSEDAEYTVAVDDPDGKTWYRTAEPAVDLSHVRCEDTHTAGPWGEDGTYSVMLVTNESGRRRWAKLWNDHAEESVGIFKGGRLVRAEAMMGQIQSFFGIDGIRTVSEAQEIAAIIRRGGHADLDP